MSARKRGTGVNTGRIESSPARQARKRRARQAEERRWAAKSGPVTTRHVDPSTLKP